MVGGRYSIYCHWSCANQNPRKKPPSLLADGSTHGGSNNGHLSVAYTRTGHWIVFSPSGNTHAAIIVGPFPTVVISAIALFFQMFVGHGGLTTIGANLFSMGIVGTFTGFATWVLLRKLRVSIFWAAGLAGAVGSVLTYVTTAFELAASLHPEALVYYWGIFAIGFVPTQVPLTIIEFVFTGLVVRYIAEVRPEMMKLNRTVSAPTVRE